MTQLGNIFKIFISCHLLFLQVAVVFSGNEGIERRTDARIEDVPFIVKILHDEKFRCGGVLVSDRRVLTASICIQGRKIDDLTVIAGTSELEGKGFESKVYGAVSYPEFDEKSRYYSVAVLALESQYTAPITLPSSSCDLASINPGDEVQLYGWYLNSQISSSPADQLQTLTTRVVDHAECQLTYSNKTGVELTENMFCAGDTEMNVCRIEKGAPVLKNGEFCGIVTLLVNCQYGDFPKGVVSYNKILPFIENALLI